MKRSGAQSQSAFVVGQPPAAPGGAATATAATAPRRLRVAAVLCSLLIAAFWLPGCQSQLLVQPEVTIAAAANLREPGKPLEFTVRVNPAPTNGMTLHVEIDAVGCALPGALELPEKLTIAPGDEEVTFPVPTDGIEMGGEEGCALTVKLSKGGSGSAFSMPHTVQVTVLLQERRPQGEISS